MRNIYWLFIVFLFNLCIFPGYCDKEKKLLGEEISKSYKPSDFLPFKMAIPEHFSLHQIEDSDWLLFGEENTLKDLESQFLKNPNSSLLPLSGIIRMKLSSNVAQIGPKIFSGSDDELKEQIKKMGGTKVHIRDLSWDEYPLKIIEGMIKGVPLRMGWVGLNCGGPVMFIHYMFPQDKKSYQHDFEIWNRFIDETRVRSEEELNSLFQQEALLED